MFLTENLKIDKDGVLEISGVKSTHLANEYGTPLLVLDEIKIMENIKRIKNVFDSADYTNYEIAYASKAFLNTELCRILQSEKVSLDVVSGGELYIAFHSSFPANKIFFNGNSKTNEELIMALENDAGHIIVDNEDEFRNIDKISKRLRKKAKIYFRVIPNISPDTHKYISTGQKNSKFGMPFDDMLKLIKSIKNSENLEIKGIHAHIGSQINEAEPYVELVKTFFDLLNKIRGETGVVLPEIDIGGGFGVAHSTFEKAIDIQNAIKGVIQEVRFLSNEFHYPSPKIIVEPGRYIISNAGTTLYTVGTIKKAENKKYVVIDGGMADNIRPALYGAKYEAFIANRPKEKTNLEKVTIAGRACESGDILIEDTYLPEIKPGDLLAIPSTGDYTYSMSSNYNGFLKPAIVLVKNGKHKVITRREIYDDLIKRDVENSEWR
ncbi:diaminopimelate decarboxylase [Petrotoga sp. 9T1HF07.CasAA.8.2]|uniref:diaminopimelate decarboxylase n=1 Tax=Petrotoga sp. 9T1HF07.CasAA.8.2 TaxID=1434329 RepID=UPI000CBA9F12|nr:diaminopimelate decarboxylase [Petrotoga sp. 9T1HF07.CasAA.8.2]PNR87176.1 diaminopimelate decarboxylase [Petrotoga sp. 9T1HF07.CasAA.8.2]